MDVLIPIVQLTSNERYFSAGWLNKSVLIQSQKLCCKSFLLPDIRATLSFFSWILFQSLKRRVSKHINLENKSVANVFFGTLETPFSTKCNVRPLMRVLLIFFKFNFSFEGGGGANRFFFLRWPIQDWWSPKGDVLEKISLEPFLRAGLHWVTDVLCKKPLMLGFDHV